MMTVEERYLRDPEFKMLVDVIYNWIAAHQATPTEVREAAMLAAIRYAMEAPAFMRSPELEELLIRADLLRR